MSNAATSSGTARSPRIGPTTIHDIEIEDDHRPPAGQGPVARRIGKGVTPAARAGGRACSGGLARKLPAKDVASRVVVGIETDRGPWGDTATSGG
jgi:hypothetical protein